jgi:hypothetical protein
MSSGVFGSIRPANLDITKDVDIFYAYRPSRGETDINFKTFKKVENTAQWLISSQCDDNIIDGLFNLKLPLDVVNKKGYYTIYITPKKYPIKITDVSVIAAYPDIKGIVLKTSDLPDSDLTGYRIDFGDGTSRLIKSCNPCEPVIVNTGDGYPKSTRYNLNAATTNLVFCTVSPSSAPTFRPNAMPYIGEPGIDINLVNTKFSPKTIEIEAVTHDIETLSYMLEGDQATDRDNAIITTYTPDGEIYHQMDYYVLKDALGNPVYNIKRKRPNIDTNQNYDNIFN